MSTKRTRSPSKPPRSIPWWALVSIAAVALASGWVGMRWGTQIAAGVHSLLVRTQTIVGLTKTSEPIDQQKDSADEPGGYYTCGMHPWVILPHEGDCPICHMKLTPLDPDKFTGEVVIDPVVVQNIGVRVEEVTQGPLVRTIRTVGNVDYDETRVRDVNTKFEGWIEKLYVDYVGAPVNEGEPLFDIYSPALYQAQEEYLLAVRAQRQRSLNNPGGTAIDLVESARTKLELFDVTDEQIDQLERTGKPSRTLKVLSPHTGVVIAKHANEGMNVTPGMQVFRIADLSRVWVHVTVYESQIPYVSVGQKAVMTLPYIPGQEFAGRVVYIYPYVDTATREVQVRLEFENQGGLLKPGMFATVELQSELRKSAVLAPRSAVISTGERNVAFVSLGQGKFEPRTVELGVETGDGLVEVLSGLTPGELVVTSGQFLLDSESRVREALAKMIRGNLASEQQAQVAVSNQTELASLPEALQHALAEALTAYFAIGDQLASDSTQSLAEPARTLAKALDAAIGTPIPDDEHFWHRHTEAATARGAALELVSLNAIDDVREKYAILSVAMDKLIRATGVPPAIGDPVESLHCPMFREGQGGAIWLQPAGAVRNPFFGSTMLKCFDKREGLPPAGSRNQPAPTGTRPDAINQTPERPQRISPQTREALDAVVAAYLQAQDLLTKDDAAGAHAALTALRARLNPLRALPSPLPAQVGTMDAALADLGEDLESIRAAFATVSDAMLELVRTAQPSNPPGGLYHAYCPMVDEDWLQTGDDVRNPYDPDMLRCGVIKGRIDEGNEQ